MLIAKKLSIFWMGILAGFGATTLVFHHQWLILGAIGAAVGIAGTAVALIVLLESN